MESSRRTGWFLRGVGGLYLRFSGWHVEGRFPEATLRELERRGHTVNRWPAWNEIAGHAQGITIDPETGARMGGADPRSDGAASGY